MSGGESHGLLARYPDSERLVAAVVAVRREGYANIDAFSPHPLDALSEALDIRDRRVPLTALACALLAGAAALALQVWSSLDYPVDAGGKPLLSWPAYVVVTVAMSMIGATLGALGAMLIGNGLPAPWHPLFDVAEFDAASRDGWFLYLDTGEPPLDGAAARDLLAETGATGIWAIAS